MTAAGLEILRFPPLRQAATLVVLLPGAYMTPQHFVDAGFPEALAGRADLALPALDLAAITGGSALETLADQVIAPARAAGYERIWLGGISLGGFMALAYAAEHAATIDGLCLFAPYPGSRITTGAIAAAGGLAAWKASPEQLADPEFRVWQWLKAPPAGLPIHCAYGRDDRFAAGMAMLAATLPAAAVHTAPGGHDWPVWRGLWQNFVDNDWLRS